MYDVLYVWSADRAWLSAVSGLQKIGYLNTKTASKARSSSKDYWQVRHGCGNISGGEKVDTGEAGTGTSPILGGSYVMHTL